jgi:CheY-like chemotaxis protein
MGWTDDSVPDFSGLRLLLVEDDPDTRLLLAELLGLTGATLTVAGTVKEALSAFELGRFDLVVSDIGIPDEDGYHLIHRLRSHGPSGASVPAIALSAFASRDDIARSLAAGFHIHVTKPVGERELFGAIASLTTEAATGS